MRYVLVGWGSAYCKFGVDERGLVALLLKAVNRRLIRDISYINDSYAPASSLTTGYL